MRLNLLWAYNTMQSEIFRHCDESRGGDLRCHEVLVALVAPLNAQPDSNAMGSVIWKGGNDGKETERE
jgi:hypothetical protein